MVRLTPAESRKKFSYHTEHIGAYQVRKEIVYMAY
jgi:hypothetical protein